MDIAIIGPEKFAFQDMVCIEMALQLRSHGNFSIVPEPKGGEDAVIVWRTPSTATLEVQVKGAGGTAGVRELADYLLHYPSRKAKGSLLERLMDDTSRHAHFVLTARCDDELALLLGYEPRDGRPGPRSASTRLASALQRELLRLSLAPAGKNEKALARKRRVNAGIVASRPISDFETALSRTSVSAQETAEKIEVRLHALLQVERFDTLSIRGILARMSDALAASKRSQLDVLSEFIAILQRYAPNDIQPVGYQARGLENHLMAHLSRERSLLIAGPPRAGKSWTAFEIAGRLQKDGYEVRQGNHVDEAERFLTDGTGSDRIYVLDDPLGSREPLSDASRRFATLRSLMERIPANRRLIVAQTEQVLLQTRAAATLSACSFGVRNWQRLNPLPEERALSVWRAAADAQGVVPSDIDLVSSLISNDTSFRDPGALVYLAQTWGELPPDPSEADILLQARGDAIDFARNLAESNMGMAELLVASAIATTPSNRAAEAELAFVINGGDARPSLAPRLSVTSFGDPPRPLPSYDSTPVLAADQSHAFGTLQRRRIIEGGNPNFNFTHPYLRAGAQMLTAPDIPSDRSPILEKVERAIACASPETSLAAARNLRWLRRLVGDGDASTWTVAKEGMRSVFPATRDCCFQFLIDFADELPPDLQKNIPWWSSRVSIDLRDIDSSQGIGVIAANPELFLVEEPVSHIQPFLTALDTGGALALDLSLSHRILQTLSYHPGILSAAAMHRFLSADEAVVRATAAGIWCSVPRDDDDDVMERIREDAVPAVSLELLNEVSQAWHSLSEERRDHILSILTAHASSPACASVMCNRLVLFDRVEYFGDEPPWRIFTALMPTVIASLPLSMSFSNGRMDSVLASAIEKAPKEELAPTIVACAERLLRRLPSYTLSEYELAIVEALLAVVKSDERLEIFRSLLTVEDTGARIVWVRGLVKAWDNLSEWEKELLVTFLQERRLDWRWTAAVVLTFSEPPERLVKVVAGDPDVFALETDELETALGTDLFAACVHMYVGWPQPLWWYATHHSGSPAWVRVLGDLARNAGHSLHGVAFYEMINFRETELLNVVEVLPREALPSTFEMMLNFKVAHVGDWRTETWCRLFELANEEGHLEEFLSQVDACLDGILEDASDIRLWLGNSPWALRILGLVPNDVRSFEVVRKLNMVFDVMKETPTNLEVARSGFQSEIMRGLCVAEFEGIEANPPRIHGTWDYIGRIFKTFGADEAVLAVVEQRRVQAAEIYGDVRENYRASPPVFTLPGWAEKNGRDLGL